MLRNVNSIEIIKYEGEKYTTIVGDGCHLGAYSSHEKALKYWMKYKLLLCK